MSVLIKGMKMPKGCYECPLTDGEYGDCKVGATGEYDPYRKDCPLEDLNVLCALADRACPFQGKEYAWCLTCPHISEEDRALVKKAIEPRTGECETCKRNVDNGGFYDDGRTRCPIQEHYALPKDGYCHLYEPRMRGEEE